MHARFIFRGDWTTLPSDKHHTLLSALRTTPAMNSIEQTNDKIDANCEIAYRAANRTVCNRMSSAKTDGDRDQIRSEFIKETNAILDRCIKAKKQIRAHRAGYSDSLLKSLAEDI